MGKRVNKSTQSEFKSKNIETGPEKNKKQDKMKSLKSQKENSATIILKDSNDNNKEMTHKLKNKTETEQGQIISLEDILDDCESDRLVEKENHDSSPISAW